MNTSSSKSVASTTPTAGIAHCDDGPLFRQTLLDSMNDGVIFVDRSQRIINWNYKLEFMTGLGAKNVMNLEFTPSILGLTDTFGVPITEQNDPIGEVLRTGKSKTGDYKISGRSGRELKIELTATPVKNAQGEVRGCITMIHDSSVQLDLQKQLKDLYEFSMLDPLTQVANRAEFERALDEFVRARETAPVECSLIICDIDFFKQINDNYNHHVGDQALIAFAGLLKEFVRNRDVVARFGGEEFVIICANCNLEAAVERAEQIRARLVETPMSMLDGKYITASFGVSQLRSNDTATDFFVRADTALLKAKETGRNRVLSDESEPESVGESTATETIAPIRGVSWPQIKGSPLLCNQFRTRTPIPVLIEKLRGYIIETDAEIRRVEQNYASLIVETEDPKDYARKGRFQVEIDFKDSDEDDGSEQHGRRTYTYLRVTIRMAKRKWFTTNTPDLAPELLAELRRYFMINDDSSLVANIAPATEHKER